MDKKNAIILYIILLVACYVLVSSTIMLTTGAHIEWAYEPGRWERFWAFFSTRLEMAFVGFFPINFIIGFVLSVIIFSVILFVKSKRNNTL